MATIRAEALDATTCYRFLTGSVVPRPIAWVGTRSRDGVRNLAPFSFFTVASVTPPVLAFSVLPGRTGEDKDTLANIRAGSDFTISIVSAGLLDGMNRSAAIVPPGTDEFELAGLAAVDAQHVDAPGVAAAGVRFECRLRELVDAGGGTLVLGDVVAFHAEDRIWQDGQISLARLDPVGKLDGNDYTLPRPDRTLARPG